MTRWQFKRRQNSRAGCAECKARRIKCDLSLPQCLNCSKRRFECPGYDTKLRWKGKHQFSKVTTSSRTTGNRPFCAAATDPGPDPSVAGWADVLLEDSHEDDDDGCRTAPGSSSQCLAVCPIDHDDLGVVPQSPFDMLQSFCTPMNRQPAEHNTFDMALRVSNPSQFQLSSDKTMLLLAYYFHTVCVFNSAYDSFTNPLRTEVQTMMATSRLLKTCILSMSAAHLRGSDPRWALDGLEYLTETTSELTREVGVLLSNGPSAPSTTTATVDHKLDQLLLGVIMLGMTTSWHASAGIGLEHISGARALFRRWISFKFSTTTGQAQAEDWARLHFLLGLQAYWEAMASFLIDQPLSHVDFLLEAFTALPASVLIHVHPWAGISAGPWLHLAKAGCLVRLKRKLEAGDSIDFDAAAGDKATMTLQRLEQEARNLAEQVVTYDVPSDSLIEETYDEHTPKSHLMDLTHCYQVAALLELHRAFGVVYDQAVAQTLLQREAVDDLLWQGMTVPEDEFGCAGELALHILQILSCIPADSGTRSLQPLLLIITGSALIPDIIGQSAQLPPWISSTQTTDSEKSPVLEYWRRFVLERMRMIESFINLDSVRTIGLLLQEIWARGDSHVWSRTQTQNAANCHHWVDVMEDSGLWFFL